MKYRMLIVDDEPANLRMLERLFRAEHDPVTAGSGTEALDLLAKHDIAIIIADQRMPGMTGIEFLKVAAQIRPQTVRIILTGYTDVGDLVEAINSGVVYKYITKPWINTDLVQTVQRAAEYYESLKKQFLIGQENERLRDQLKTTVKCVVTMLLEMVAEKKFGLVDHCRRTASIAELIGGQFKLGPKQMEQLNYASMLHEVPNLRLPFDLSMRKTAFTDEQLKSTRQNYESGLELISSVPELEQVALILRHQHERFDGSGFFDGLDGDVIPLLSRILAVANAFDEITLGSDPALFTIDEETADRLRSRAGFEFDPEVVELCLKTKLIETTSFSNRNIPRGTTQSLATAVP